jgi:osmotically-inducible protein OsmY
LPLGVALRAEIKTGKRRMASYPPALSSVDWTGHRAGLGLRVAMRRTPSMETSFTLPQEAVMESIIRRPSRGGGTTLQIRFSGKEDCMAGRIVNRRNAARLLCIAAGLLFAVHSAWAFVPWTAVYKAFKDPRSYMVQARDSKTELALKSALLLDDPSTVLDITTVCLMGHVFLTGQVDSARQRATLIEEARQVSDVRSVDAYLPTKAELVPGDLSAMEVKMSLFGSKDASPETMNIRALGGAVVLMGVVSTAQDRDAVAKAAAKVDGVAEVVNFLLLPEAGSEKALEGVLPSRERKGPLRRLLSE